ncbi:hypothetical protein E6C76_04005 [Pseudothauera nasutitermitis]|uniref:Uncharacterized protein n=1 Tax=Pseudothauera nasutitermitis TaxID=2565930 RepID=A0A4S4B4F5_9RHOO|nr:hypothetical protein [Pseudothauera nasutitermitis]THF67529.1 hypothetical protein E6C76_04005 [Pseudothauera nasutitermitis]
MSTAFVRQLGSESGVQLNPLRDNSEIPTTDNSDQVFGIMMRATRGRIDKPFAVDRGNVFKKLGSGEQVRLSALNEAWVHVVEALNKGAYQAIVQRLSTSAAVIKYAVVALEMSTGETPAPTGNFTFTVSETLPATPYLFAVKHLECFNDGIVLEFRAEEVTSGGLPADNDKLTLRLRDKDGNLLYEFYGSLKSDAKDDYGNSAYLPDVALAQTDAVEITTGVTGASAVIDSDSVAYGYDTNGQQKWAKSGTLVCFVEGGTAYTTQDYMAARDKLQYTQFDYAYISAGGTQAPALLAQLAQLAFDTNRQLRFGIPGNLAPEAAVAFVNQLNMGASQTAHLMHAFWAPLKSDDPTGINPHGYFGTETLNIAYGCGRNAQKNAKGFAPKNYPIAGREWPLQRTRIVQTYSPTNQELNLLARAKINPVIYETYTGGGRYVFRDSLTCALVESSLKKLIAVADMSTSIDESVTRAAKDFLQLPMDVSVKKMRDFLTTLFEGAQASGWLVPSNDPQMNGAAWAYDVRPNEQRPYDAMDVSYWLRYDGTNRQTFVTQTLTK